MNPQEQILNIFLKSSGVFIDSRRAISNGVFFAFRGKNVNGAQYAESVLQKGALCAIVDDERYASIPGVILVDDVLASLQSLAHEYRMMLKIPIVAITGSNGKTTTKELFLVTLMTHFKVTCTQGNYNNHIGVPLTLLSIPLDAEIAIVEMGANHMGEIRALCEIAQPTHGYITNIGKAHLEGFGSIEGVLKAKLELFDFIDSNRGILFLNSEDKWLQANSKNYTNIVEVNGENLPEPWSLLSQASTPELHLSFSYNDIVINCQTALIGRYNVSNICAALFMACYLGIDFELGVRAIEKYVPDNNRSSYKTTNGLHFIMDAYNANPSSMKNAIEHFAQLEVHPKVLILGDMFELGESTQSEHQSMIDFMQCFKWHRVLLIGRVFGQCESPNYEKTTSLEDAQQWIKSNLVQDTWILLKGSRSMGLERLVE